MGVNSGDILHKLAKVRFEYASSHKVDANLLDQLDGLMEEGMKTCEQAGLKKFIKELKTQFENVKSGKDHTFFVKQNAFKEIFLKEFGEKPESPQNQSNPDNSPRQ
jgi:hypothetical protein